MARGGRIEAGSNIISAKPSVRSEGGARVEAKQETEPRESDIADKGKAIVGSIDVRRIEHHRIQVGGVVGVLESFMVFRTAS